MEKTKHYRKNDSMVARKIADEVMLVPIRQNVADLQAIYTLNEVGARIWELLDTEEAVANLTLAIAGEYEVELHQAESDVVDFLTQLESVGALTKA